MLTDIRQKIARQMDELSPMNESKALSLFEVPKSIDHGHLALPVFFLAKELRKAPPLIAKDLAGSLQESLSSEEWLEKVEPVGGYLNFTLNTLFVQKRLHQTILGSEKLGYSQSGQGKKLVIDYSSPNVAKPMNIGHLRATVIGQAIRNLAETQGYEVVGINHLGDWGVQFGKLAWAYQNWGAEYAFDEKPFESLFQLYVRFHDEAEKNEELNKLGSLTFKKLEEGDAEIEKIWKMFLDISLKEYQRLWDLLGVKHDLVRGESFFNDKLKDAEKRLEDKNLLVESEGAFVVDLEEEGMPPCLVRKSDGSSLYATRDLAAAIYRKEELDADLNIYVVGMDQTLHFKQVFKVLDKLGYDWAAGCHHVSFGMYRFAEGRMSTRKGNVIFLEDVLSKAQEMMTQVIQEKNPDLENAETVARQVGIGAVIFNDLVNDRNKNVDFEWERILDFEGNSGPYVQYCQVRCHSVLKKVEIETPILPEMALESAEERELARYLIQYPDTLAGAFQSFKPNILAQYLLEVCRSFNHFYQKHRVKGEDLALQNSRAALVYATREVLRAGLKVLNIESPEAM